MIGHRKHSRRGQTMIEALVSIGVAITILSAITAVVLSSLNNSTFTKNQDLATTYAKEGIETIRRYTTSNYDKFVTDYPAREYCLDSRNTLCDKAGGGGTLCRDEDGNVVVTAGTCNGVKTEIYIREVTLTRGNQAPECQQNLKASVKVSWTDSRCPSGGELYCHNVTLNSCFSDTNIQQSPLR